MNKIIFFLITIFLSFLNNLVYAEVIKKIEIFGNERISNETILMFSDIQLSDDFNINKSNKILKELYKSNFFDDVSVKYNSGVLTISVNELPLIEKITIEGVKAKKFNETIEDSLLFKSRSSFNKILLTDELKSIKTVLKNFGYYFATVEVYVEEINNNMVNLKYKIDLGDKAKIKKITFIGKKIFKDRVLRNIIVSEEYKFWKFISNKKFLNEELIKIDMRLLNNFYLNKGYLNVEINSSFAKLIDNDEFELIYNISPKNKIYFNNLKIVFPNDFSKANYENLNTTLENLKGEPYSINAIENILDKIDNITINEEFKSIKATINEKVKSDKLDIDFIIEETEKYFVEKVNVLGNNITNESVIRNQLEIDEGDPFNEILLKKSENNIKALNFFRNVNMSVVDGKNEKSKIMNIDVEEKPTGEISAGAGAGTSGGTVFFGVKENNYLGRGVSLDTNATISEETFKGIFSMTDPNYKNTDKVVYGSVQAIERDQLSNFGYKTNKTGFKIGTKLEYLDDFFLGISTDSFYEKIETDATASLRQKSQEGNYWDTFINFDFDYDKRNQKYKTTSGFISNYSTQLPLISDTNTLTNSYLYKVYSELYENNVTSLSIYLKSANSISGNDIKLSERINVPSRRLRGFESGKVGPKDGNDFIGGNYITTLNFNSSLPQLFPNLQNIDVSLFLDAANIWGVDYDSSLDDGSKIRSSVGIGVEWFTIVGPLTFSLSEVITKNSTDVEESFRFNLGTTF